MLKSLQGFFTIALSVVTINAIAQTGKWTPVKAKAPHYNMGACLLMTDGTVICHNTSGGGEGTGWDRLTPDIYGSYANGTWDTINPMTYDRLFFSSQVLPDGRVYAAGGEYGAGGVNGEIYDPKTNTWTTCNPIPSGWNLYDANSELLYNGQVLEGPQISDSTSFSILLLDPKTMNYTKAPNSFYNHDEAAWLKLPDSSVLFVGIASSSSNRYIPQTNSWVYDANLPVDLYDGLEEAGSAYLLPNGKAIFFGATPANAIYTPSGNTSPGSWIAADSFPTIQGCPAVQSDASGAMMVNGHILLSVSPSDACAGSFAAPCYFLEYDYNTNKFTQVMDSIPGMNGDSIPVASYQTQMLDLPDGNVLVSVSQTTSYSKSYLIYTPGSNPIPQGKPTIDNVTKVACNKYMITGKLFNGISEGASFGDDWQVATNYPIIRLTDGTHVYYCTTSNWNRIGAVQTDSLEDTAYFTVPSIPAASYSLILTANGFASSPYPLKTYGVGVTSVTNIACLGNLGNIVVSVGNGVSPYTYSWSPTGGTTDTASNLSGGTYTCTVTDNAGCVVTASATITQPSPMSLVVDSALNVSCKDAATGQAQANVYGGTPSYTYVWTGGYTSAKVTNLTAGNYTVTVIDSCGGTVTASVTITQPATTLSVTSSSKQTSPCNGQAWATATGGNPGYTYLWSPGGQTSDTATALCDGSYCCTVTDANGCSVKTCVSLVLGVNNLQSGSADISIYPVPNQGSFTIAFGHPLSGNVTVEVYNVLGSKVYNELLTSTQQDHLINMTTQPAGIYFLRVLNNDGSLAGSGKVVIDR